MMTSRILLPVLGDVFPTYYRVATDGLTHHATGSSVATGRVMHVARSVVPKIHTLASSDVY